MEISKVIKKYHSKISPIDLEILISHTLKRDREFVLTNPGYKPTPDQELDIKNYIKRRINKEPIAYIIGHKEFYGLNFEVDNSTLIPRPETELIVELLLNMLRNKVVVVDIGTGSGNIITSISKNSKLKNVKYFGIDISEKALKMAKKNAKSHGVNKKIEFLHGNLLKPIIQNSKFKIQNSKMIITANLPYLSNKIYSESPEDVRKYEPKTALYSGNYGLAHYEELLIQLKKFIVSQEISITLLLEISPEQKNKLGGIIKKYFSKANIKFHKDLAEKWRVCEINI